ncbi:YrdB family protein [Streptomyces sp. NPDC005728]|uniref:YrdB family protein n=1 Tax=Streptomyces sp. NPDC005728 TaxID=3157054 RepID=UPI0033DC38AD
MKTVKAVNLGVELLLTLGVLGAVWYWGYERGGTSGLLTAVFGTALLGEVWGLFGASKARFRLQGAARGVFESLWFGLGVVALYAAGAYAWALALALVCLAAKALAYAWDQ